MKLWSRYSCFSTLIGLLVLALLVSGCTSQPAPVPQSPTITAATPVQTPAAVATALPNTLTSTTWNLAWFADGNGAWSKVAEGSTVFATFISENKVTGSGGCNGYTSDYQAGNGSWIQIKRPVVTDRLCQAPSGVMSQESIYFTNLEWAETYSITNGQLLIFDRANKKILQFDPA